MIGILGADGLSPAQVADRAVTELRRGYAKGKDIIWENTGGLFAAVFGQSDEHKQIRAAYTTLGKNIEAWASTKKAWALRGVRDDGTRYSTERWLDEGRVYADAVAYQAKVAIDGSAFKLAVDTARATTDTVTNPDK